MDLGFTKFTSFLNSVKKLTGAELALARKVLKSEGQEITSIDDIFVNKNGELFEVLPDGKLLRVNLYISSDSRYSNPNTVEVRDLYKYHIYTCSTVSNMFSSGRKHRYRVNNRDDGSFYYLFSDHRGRTLKKNENQKLHICKNCLKKIRGSSTNTDVSNFNLNKFHTQHISLFDFDTSDIEKGEHAIPNVYVRDWEKISTQIKKRKNYTCEKCGYISEEEYTRRFIHTHHTNGDKQNNRSENLQVLCIKCHAEVDTYHHRIKSMLNYKEFILSY